MNTAMTRVLIGIGAPVLLGAAAVAAEKTPDAQPPDPTALCTQMMQGADVTEEGKKAMREFMQSPRALTVNPKKPDEVYAVTVDAKLYRSADGGRQWGESR